MNKYIYLLQDCDCDGLLATSMLYCYLRLINPDIDIIPILHDDKSHGLNDKKVMEYLLCSEPSLLIIPDAGSNDIKQIELLANRGFDIVILDHHETDEATTLAVIVNNQLSQNVQNKSLSGCGVTWKFMTAYDKKYGYKFANQFISYVAISLVADSMDLSTLENRLFLYGGLKNIHPNIHPFIEAWCKNELSPTEFSFNVINRFNSLIRNSTQDAKLNLFRCLCGEGDVKQCIKDCVKAHNYQKQYIKDKSAEILENVDLSNKILVLETDEKSGYTGLVANKIMSAYNKPTLLVYKDGNKYFGSGRGQGDFKDIVSECKDVMFARGHQGAFGVGWTASNHDSILKYLYAVKSLPEPSETVLSSYTSSNIPHNLFGLFEQYEDLWGQGVSRPKFHITNIHINSSLIKEIRYDAQIMFYCNGIAYKKKFVSRDVKKSTWHMNENIDLNIECIGELLIDGYNNQPYVLMDKVAINIDKNEYDLDEIFKEY